MMRMLLMLLVVSMGLNSAVFAQDDEMFTNEGEPAQPDGGYFEFEKFLKNELKYPEQAKRMGVRGKVYVEAIVDTTGTLTEIRVVKGIGAGCDEEAQRLAGISPKWEPAQHQGKKLKQRVIFPVTFKLDEY